MTTVLTVFKHAGPYTQRYVDNLYTRLQALHPGTDIVVLCETPHLRQAKPHLWYEPLRHDWPGHYAKVEMFRPDLLETYGRMLFLDLSVVLVGTIKGFLDYDAPDPCVTADFYWGGPSQSVLSWNDYELCRMYEAMVEKPKEWIARGNLGRMPEPYDQALIRGVDLDVTWKYWQDVLPGQLVSYKEHCRGFNTPPDCARIVKFHGKPKPHQVDDAWVVRNWSGS